MSRCHNDAVLAADKQLDVEELDVEEEYGDDDAREHEADTYDYVYQKIWEGESQQAPGVMEDTGTRKR